MNMSFIRLTMGASDFSLDNYTYNDTVDNIEDMTLSQFSIQRETEHLIPILKEALDRNSIYSYGITLECTAWMKNNKHMNGGSLLDKYMMYMQHILPNIFNYGK